MDINLEKYANKQPKDGDVILLCVHMDAKSSDSHWFKVPPDGLFEVIRPDGTKVKGDWLCVCPECFKEMMFQGKDPKIGDDRVYKGEHLGPLVMELPKA